MTRQLVWFLLAACVAAGAQNNPERRRLRLCAEVTGVITVEGQEELLRDIEKAVREYNVDEIIIHGFQADRYVTLAGFPKLQHKADTVDLARYRRRLQRIKSWGVKLTAGSPEPNVPKGFFEAYPEARDVNNGLFWRFIEERTAENLRVIPELDRLEFHLWETSLLNDSGVFKDFYWAEDYVKQYYGISQYHSPSDYIAELLSAFGRGARAAGRQAMFMTFCHYPWQERLNIEALRNVDPTLPLVLDHKSQPGDWDPFRPANNVMLEVTDREAMILYDGVGEYWGRAFLPYCFPEEIQARLQEGLRRNPSLRMAGMRVHWGNHLFGTSNEINFYALAQLVKDPDMPVEEIWRTWAEKRFGKAAAPKVISALRRSDDIGKLTYYFKGMWVQKHSAIADLPYMEAQVLHTGKSMIEWAPGRLEDNALLREFMYHPREHTIEMAVADRLEALRLNRLSMRDVEDARPQLPAEEYLKLKEQFTVQRHLVETSIPHIEAFLRYWIQRKMPSAANLAKLEKPLAELSRKADEIEAAYGTRIPVLRAKNIRDYVQQVRAAVAKLPGSQEAKP